jgi:hypothetical protein
MIRIVQIGSYFYGALEKSDGSFSIISKGYQTKEHCQSMIKMWENIEYFEEEMVSKGEYNNAKED